MSQFDISDHFVGTGLQSPPRNFGLGAMIAALLPRRHGRSDAVAQSVSDDIPSVKSARRRRTEGVYLADIGMAVDF